MRRSLAAALCLSFFLGLATLPAFAQVQTVGDVSFAVPDGWTYTAGRDFGAMIFKEGASVWMLEVFSPMSTSGDAVADFKAAWKRAVLDQGGYQGYPGWGSYSTYEMPKTVGYSGRFNDDASVDKKSYARVYALETGKSCIPVAVFSGSRGMMDSLNYMELAIVGSVRQLPLKASAIRQNITTADLEGLWAVTVGSLRSFYNSAGQFTGNSITTGTAKYNIAANGRYSYSYNGLQSNRVVNDDDTGVVELGGGFITFKGQKRQPRYRFVNIQQAIDGSSVLTLFPPAEMSKINPKQDSEYLIRGPRN